MKTYRNLSGLSGIELYESREDYIIVQFDGGGVYRYSYAKAGERHVEEMKKLAQEGRGLATYITRYVKDLYDRTRKA